MIGPPYPGHSQCYRDDATASPSIPVLIHSPHPLPTYLHPQGSSGASMKPEGPTTSSGEPGKRHHKGLQLVSSSLVTSSSFEVGKGSPKWRFSLSMVISTQAQGSPICLYSLSAYWASQKVGSEQLAVCIGCWVSLFLMTREETKQKEVPADSTSSPTWDPFWPTSPEYFSKLIAWALTRHICPNSLGPAWLGAVMTWTLAREAPIPARPLS